MNYIRFLILGVYSTAIFFVYPIACYIILATIYIHAYLSNSLDVFLIIFGLLGLVANTFAFSLSFVYGSNHRKINKMLVSANAICSMIRAGLAEDSARTNGDFVGLDADALKSIHFNINVFLADFFKGSGANPLRGRALKLFLVDKATSDTSFENIILSCENGEEVLEYTKYLMKWFFKKQDVILSEQ
jgi:Co/Zn/Cd efflux system component